MNVTISAALLTGVVTIVLIVSKRVGGGAALFVWLSGFTAAATGLAGPVNALLAAAAHAIGH